VIGSAISMAMAEKKIKTVILDLNSERAQSLATEIREKTGTECVGISGNVVDKNSLEEAKKMINDKVGKIDFLINGAGGNSPKATTSQEEIKDRKILEGSFLDLSMEGFEFVFDLNIIGTVLPTIVFSKDMIDKGEGVVLNISSMNAYRPLTKIPAYSAAKAAINNFTEWLAVHFAKTGIRVNAIAPGFFVTDQNRFLLFNEDGSLTERGHKIISNTPMDKFGDVEDLTGTVLFLLSDLSKFVTGVIIPVDGGFNAYSGV
ncbi:SDR family oxidoreductase, partial [Bacteroidota bacterium]